MPTSPSTPSLNDYRSRLLSSGQVRRGKNAERRSRCVGSNLVSIVTICFNSERTIAKTIDSVCQQTYQPIEYVVIDGGSTDGTKLLLEQRSADIDVWISEPDEGISDAFNKGVAIASGEFIALVNSDDWLDPTHMEHAVQALSAAPQADFVFGDLALYGNDGDRVHFFSGDQRYTARIAHDMPFLNHPSVLCRRSAFEKIGLFDTSLRTAMDYDWFLRLHKAGGRGLFVDRLLAHMLLDGQSDRNFMSAMREVREVSIKQGYPKHLAWTRYIYRVIKSNSRRILQKYLPVDIYERIRRMINAQYRNNQYRADQNN